MSISNLVDEKAEVQSTSTVSNSKTFRWLFSAGFSAIIKAGNFLISGYKTQVLFVLSQSKVVGLKSSNDWGVLSPENNGQILLLPGDFVEVIVPHTNSSREAILDKQLWKIKELKFLKPDSLLTQLQTDIAVVILAKISLKKELEKLIEEFKETETLYELTDYCQECTIKHNELCLHQLEAIVQLENLQLIQNEYIQKLLLALNFVDLEKESIAESFVCYQQAAEEAQQKYQEILAYTNKLKLRAANIVSQVSMIEATK